MKFVSVFGACFLCLAAKSASTLQLRVAHNSEYFSGGGGCVLFSKFLVTVCALTSLNNIFDVQ